MNKKPYRAESYGSWIGGITYTVYFHDEAMFTCKLPSDTVNSIVQNLNYAYYEGYDKGLRHALMV